MRAALLAVVLLAPGVPAVAAGMDAASVPASSGRAATALDPLSAPGDYSLAPASALPPILPPILPPVAGGVASTSFGSNGYHASSIELDSGLIGNTTRAFVAFGAGQGPHWRDAPSVNVRSVAAGVSTALPFGTTLTVSAGVQQDRLSHPY